jgi:hypothetical protein
MTNRFRVSGVLIQMVEDATWVIGKACPSMANDSG